MTKHHVQYLLQILASRYATEISQRSLPPEFPCKDLEAMTAEEFEERHEWFVQDFAIWLLKQK